MSGGAYAMTKNKTQHTRKTQDLPFCKKKFKKKWRVFVSQNTCPWIVSSLFRPLLSFYRPRLATSYFVWTVLSKVAVPEVEVEGEGKGNGEGEGEGEG